MSKILDILYKKESGGKLIKTDTVSITKEDGIIGDYHGKSRTAQITLLSKKAWDDANYEIGSDLSWEARRSNILIDKIDLKDSIGKLIKLGDDVVLEITGECKPCNLMEKTKKGLFKALEKDWRGGVETIVARPGTLKIGDEVFFV